VERERAQSLIEGKRFLEVDVSRFDEPGDVAQEVARILIEREIFPPVSPGKAQV